MACGGMTLQPVKPLAKTIEPMSKKGLKANTQTRWPN